MHAGSGADRTYLGGALKKVHIAVTGGHISHGTLAGPHRSAVGGVGRSWYILGGCAGGAKWRYMAIFGSREARSSDAWLHGSAWL